jgi:serine/threonine protein kinase
MFTRIEQYRILKEIGGGGFAKVYLAQDEQLQRDVAIKVMHANLAENSDYRRFFEREARLVASFENLAVVPIYDYGEIEGQLFLVMRYMRGGTLADRLEKSKKALPLHEVIALIERLAPTLDAIHQKGVIHRDLKPSNILYDENDVPYIADFGIARMQQATTRMTQTGISFGTLQYSSPEQVTGEGSLDHKSDIYTLGIILYELLTGQYPFWSDTPLGWVHKHAEAPIPNVREANRALPAGLTEIIEGMLAKAPADRYPTVQAVVDDLKRAEVGKPIVFQGKPQPVRPLKKSSVPITKGRGQHRLAYGLAGGAVLLVLAALALLVWENGGFGGISTADSASPTPTLTENSVVVVETATSDTGAVTQVVPTATVPPPTATRIVIPTELPATLPPAMATATALQQIGATATAQAAAVQAQLPPAIRNREPFLIPYASTAPTLDGDLSEWELQSFKELPFVRFRPENVQNSQDLSGACVGRWTTDALYLACRIQDDVLVQTASGNLIFQGDSIELLFDSQLQQDVESSTLDDDDFQIGLLPGGIVGRDTEAYRWFPQEREGALTSVTVAGQPSAYGYTVEVMIPWGEIGIKPQTEAAYGFGMSVNDNDSPGIASQESQLSLFANQQLINPTTWGLLILLGNP